MKLIMGTGGRGEGNGKHYLISPVIVFFFLGNCQLVRNLFANLNVSSESTDVSPVPLNLHLWITRTSSECACISRAIYLTVRMCSCTFRYCPHIWTRKWVPHQCVNLWSGEPWNLPIGSVHHEASAHKWVILWA